ncbi:hypothetical protein GCM10023339_27960 [Alloalcanivorax gelatiniphagus]
MRLTDTARPTWTQSMEATAIEVPVRAGERDMAPVEDTGIVHVHVTPLDTPFIESAQ